MKKKLYFIVVLFLLKLNIFSQSPNWQVNENQFQYTMTTVAFLNINGTTLSSTEDKVAAFVDGELRGSANLIYVSSTDRYLAYLVIFSNSTNETINFKIYNSNTDEIIDLSKTLNFAINQHYGNVFQAYSLASPVLSNESKIIDYNFEGTTINKSINSNKITIESNVFVADNIKNLNSNFVLSDGAKLFENTNQIVSGDNLLDYSSIKTLNVLSEDESVYEEWTIEIINVDKDNDGAFSDIDCDDNEPLAFPGNAEILNDGIDNDCDPSTLDIIVKKTITITADSKTKVYGDDDPELTYSITTGDLESGDVLAGSLTRAPGEDAGEYAITSTLSNDNYDITFVSNNLSITKKPITITADSKTKVYGDDDPELTYTITQGVIINNDSFSGSLIREEGEAIGLYTILQGTLSLGINYEITFIESNLEITSSLGVDAISLQSKIKIYPIPTNEYINIETPKTLQLNKIEIYNVLGKIVFLQKKNTSRLSLSALNKGMYLVKISTDLGFVIRKIIIK